MSQTKFIKLNGLISNKIQYEFLEEINENSIHIDETDLNVIFNNKNDETFFYFLDIDKDELKLNLNFQNIKVKTLLIQLFIHPFISIDYIIATINHIIKKMKADDIDFIFGTVVNEHYAQEKLQIVITGVSNES